MVGVVMSEADVLRVLAGISDPEIPALSIVDLKIVRAISIYDEAVSVDITPTFVGCPALDSISEMIRATLLDKGFKTVHVKRDYAARWSTEMLDESVRKKLEKFGIAPPSRSSEVVLELPTLCPFCRSANTQLENPFGASLCKQLYYCNSCRESFEKFKAI